MSNGYFTHDIKLLPGTKARAEDVNARFDGAVLGFDKLPAPHPTLKGFADPVVVGDPTEQNHAVPVSKAIGGALTYAADTGLANAYVVDLSLSPASYSDGLTVVFKALNSNTGAATINVNGLGVKQLVRANGVALEHGDIVAGQIITCIFNGTKFFGAAAFQGQFDSLQNVCQGYANAASASEEIATAKAGEASADAVATAADRVQTGLDRDQTGSDVVQTGLDRVATAADRVQTGQDKVATATDRVQTGEDKNATAADRIQTGLDRTQTGLDRAATGNDRATCLSQAGIATTKAGDAGVAAAAAAASAALFPVFGADDIGKVLTVAPGPSLAYKSQVDPINDIINGGFDFWRRGPLSQTGNGYLSADMWNPTSAGSTHVFSRQSFPVGQTDVPGNPKYFGRMVVNSVAGANNYSMLAYKVSGVTKHAGEAVYLPVHMRADAARPVAVELIQDFGTGGSPSTRVVVGAQKINVSTVFAEYILKFDVPSVSGKTIGTGGNDSLLVRFWFDSGSAYASEDANMIQQSGTFDIANFGMHSIPMHYQNMPEALERILCEQFCFVSDSLTVPAVTTGSNYNIVCLPTTMRVTPSATLYSDPAGTVGKVRIAGAQTEVAAQIIPSRSSIVIVNSVALPGAPDTLCFRFVLECNI